MSSVNASSDETEPQASGRRARSGKAWALKSGCPQALDLPYAGHGHGTVDPVAPIKVLRSPPAIGRLEATRKQECFEKGNHGAK